jgi:transposase
MTPCRRSNFDPLTCSPGSSEPGGDGVLSVEDWAEIRRLHRAEGLAIKMIARTLGISRNTVRAAIASDGPPKYERKSAGSVVDAVEPRIRELLQAYPTMPATVIAERIGWERGLTVLKDRVRELRPAATTHRVCRRADPLTLIRNLQIPV